MSAALVESVRAACYNGPARVVLPDHESRSTESRTALASRSDEACDSRGAAFLFAEIEMRMTPDREQRFWSKVVADPGTGCWVWGGAVDTDGYGRLIINGAVVKAHRVLWEHERGPIPEGFVLDHLCRNPSCVRLDHLEPVTPVENTMRGVSFGATNASKQHCHKGHEYSEENTDYKPRGGRGGPLYRVCRICKKASDAANHVLRKARRGAARSAIVDRILGGS